jgi:hypothetical protein
VHLQPAHELRQRAGDVDALLAAAQHWGDLALHDEAGRETEVHPPVAKALPAASPFKFDDQPACAQVAAVCSRQPSRPRAIGIANIPRTTYCSNTL